MFQDGSFSDQFNSWSNRPVWSTCSTTVQKSLNASSTTVSSLLTLLSECFSVFPHGTFSLSSSFSIFRLEIIISFQTLLSKSFTPLIRRKEGLLWVSNPFWTTLTVAHNPSFRQRSHTFRYYRFVDAISPFSLAANRGILISSFHHLLICLN